MSVLQEKDQMKMKCECWVLTLEMQWLEGLVIEKFMTSAATHGLVVMH